MRLRTKPIGDKNVVGERIELRRKELAMKQTELIKRLKENGMNITCSGMSKIEGCLRQVYDTELVALSRALDVSVDWLLGIE